MTAPAADTTPNAEGPRLSAGLLVAAAAEIAVAIAVATVMLRLGHAAPDMSAMHSHDSTQIRWPAATLGVAVLTGAVLIWRWFGPAILAVPAAGGLVYLGVSEPVRTIVTQSHLLSMAALETMLVAVPLLLIGAFRHHFPARSGGSGWWAIGTMVATVVNSAVLIAVHLPSIHTRSSLHPVPVWLPVLGVAIGWCYWAAILLTAGRVPESLRRGALIIGQEVAAVLGLATLLQPPAVMRHDNPLGLTQVLDQRLGALLMLITCAAVTLPLLERLNHEEAETESHVH
ncbi:hypothetical protein [[Mycobacterium] vasticus]|uniref:Integral membrane protein n=1 Tax=[Mycobacterium] vasticus TaxID=2875777 RepID=A0ABU5Z0I1_9MYCO|nr:hypothetical protein [Mycolicibacter sp. MYC017]MEB3070655.1 hypothetical protein [Mycolicibacter sp. MYC017]